MLQDIIGYGVVLGFIVAAVVAKERWSRHQRQRALAYLDAMGDDDAAAVETGTRVDAETYQRDRRDEVARLAFARYDLGPPWSDLQCSLGAAGFPKGMEPQVFEDPREIEPLCCWVSDPGARAQLAAPAVQAALRRFLSGDGARTIRGGEARIEIASQGADPMAVAAMQTDVADLIRALE